MGIPMQSTMWKPCVSPKSNGNFFMGEKKGDQLLGRALIDGRMVSCTFISVLIQMYEWWYGKSSALAIRNACATSHVHVYILACHILTSKKTTSVETLSSVFTSVHDFYFHPPHVRQVFFNLQKVETVAREPRLDSFQKVHGFSWCTIPDVLNSKKRSHDVPSQMCWIPSKDLMTYHPRCVEFQEKISWRTIPNVLNSKKKSHDVPSQMCWIPRKDLMTYHPRCVEFQEKISWRTIPDVLNFKKRSHDVPSQMCWIPRKDLMTYHPRCLEFQEKISNVPSQMCWIPSKDLMTYHPRCVEFQEKISWRTIPDVLNSKKRYHDVPSQMCWIPRKDLMTYHPRCVEFQEKISWRTIPNVLNSKKKSHDVPSQMCWIPGKDLMTHHPRCVEFQEKISWRTIPDVLNSKKRSHVITSQMCSSPKNVITPPHPPNQHHAKKNNKKRGFTEAKHNKKGKNALSLWRQCSEHAKTLFRDAAFCARPANYYSPHIWSESPSKRHSDTVGIIIPNSV